MHAPGMAVSLSPASYALAGDSYFADLYHPTSPSIAAYSPSSDGFPWVLGSSGGAYSPPSQSPPRSKNPSCATRMRTAKPERDAPRRHSPPAAASPPYRPTLDFAPARRPSPDSGVSVHSPSGPEDNACEAHSHSHSHSHAECAAGEDGHMCAATEHKLKRRAQNRAAQRAFRARQTARVKELEREVARVGGEYEALRGRFERLRGGCERCCGAAWEDDGEGGGE